MGDKNFRLSRSVRPERYMFHVKPDVERGTFTAHGTIDIVTDEAITELVLHGVDLDVTRALAAGGEARVTRDADSQTLHFALHSKIGPAAFTIALEWSGVLHKDLRGLYRAGPVGVTQFEAADARRVFPCFDEPPFKAVWELSIEGPADWALLSNSPVADEEAKGATRVVRFQPTPQLSSYLVAFVVGPLVSSTEQVANGIPIRTWSTREKAALTGFAQECASVVLPLLEEYFGYPYVFRKLDQVGVPEFEAGAMENAGLVTFREILLLIEPSKTPLSLQKRVAEVITHELAHQWFGNLVTMQWWDDLWLNEAFATWMAYKIVDKWRPGWRLWDDFDAGKSAALALDALESSHPIRAEVPNAEAANESFDLITYEKGGAMLRMIEGYLGEGKFRDGIRDYMKKHEWSNTVAADLWNALGRASGQPIGRLADDWIGRAGFPLVTASLDGDSVRFEQRRFHADPAADPARWRDERPWLVPIVARWADDAGAHESRLLLDGKTGEMKLGARGAVRYLCANASGAGFYRVRYTPEGIAQLARHRAELAPVERMNLLGDASALFRAGVGPLASLLDLVTAFAADEDYAELSQVVGSLAGLERHYTTPENRATVRHLVEELLAPHLAALGWDAPSGEADDRRLRRAAAVRGLALSARVPSVVSELSSRLARAWASDAAGEPALDANLLDTAAVAAARVGDAQLFDQLAERARTHADPSEKRRALVSLASVEAPALVERAIALALTDAIPQQDTTVYLGTLLGNEAARAGTWSMIRTRWSELKQRLSPSLMRRMVESLRELVDRRAEVEAFLAEHAQDFATVPQVVAQTREQLRLDEDARRRGQAELAAWLTARR